MDRSEMIEKNVPLVHSIVKKFLDRGVSYEDLLSAGIIGLITAVDKFDPDRGFKFSTYAYNWIQAEIRKEIQENMNQIKLPGDYWSAKKHYINAIGMGYSHEMAIKLTAEVVGVTVNKIQSILKAERDTLSLDAIPVGVWGGEVNYKDILIDYSAEFECGIDDEVDGNPFFKEVVKLPKRERNIIFWRIGYEIERPLSLREIGKILSLSPERVRQIEAVAIQKIRDAVKTGFSGVNEDNENDQYKCLNDA